MKQRRSLQLETLDPRRMLAGDFYVHVDADGGSSTGVSDIRVLTPLAGGRGGAVDIRTGVSVDAGSGADGELDLSEPTLLLPGEYHFQQISGSSPLYVYGTVAMRVAGVLNRVDVRGCFGGWLDEAECAALLPASLNSAPPVSPQLAIYAQTLGPTNGRGGQFRVRFTPPATTDGPGLDGGVVRLYSADDKTVLAQISAEGGAGGNGGRGGDGGQVKLIADGLEESQVNVGVVDVSGGASTLSGYQVADWSYAAVRRNQADGGDGGTVFIKSDLIHADYIHADGGSPDRDNVFGRLYTFAVWKDPVSGEIRGDAEDGHGDDGGDGGVIMLAGELNGTIYSLTAAGGDGADGLPGRSTSSPGSAAYLPESLPADGRDGGDGGAPGEIRIRSQRADASYEIILHDVVGGDGGDGGFGGGPCQRSPRGGDGGDAGGPLARPGTGGLDRDCGGSPGSGSDGGFKSNAPAPWNNPIEDSDVNGDGDVTIRDLGYILSALARSEAGPLSGAPTSWTFLDAHANNELDLRDAVTVIRELFLRNGRRGAGSGEGEGEGEPGGRRTELWRFVPPADAASVTEHARRQQAIIDELLQADVQDWLA